MLKKKKKKKEIWKSFPLNNHTHIYSKKNSLKQQADTLFNRQVSNEEVKIAEIKFIN